MTDAMKKQLIRSGIEVRENSYSPYSKFKVGAALLASSGRYIPAAIMKTRRSVRESVRSAWRWEPR